MSTTLRVPLRDIRPRRGTRTARIAAIWLVALAPVAFLPGLEDRWGWPKLCVAAIALLCALWAVPSGSLPRWLGWLGLSALIVFVVAALLGPAPLAQLLGRAPRYEGIFGLLPIVLTMITGARLFGPASGPDSYRHFANASSLASLSLAAIAGLEAVGLRPIESDLARPGSLAGNATDQGILGAVFVAILGSVLIGSARRTGKASPWVAAGTAAGVFAVATSASRAALIALTIVLIGLAARWVLSSTHRTRAVIVAGAVLIASAVVIVSIPLTRTRLLGTGGLAGQTVTDRVAMWGAALRLVGESPMLGVGASGFMDAVTAVLPADWYRRTDPSVVLDSPHNVVLQVLLAGGIVALILVVMVVVAIAVAGSRQISAATGARRDLLLAASLAWAGAGVALLTTPTSPTILLTLALLGGAAVARAPRPSHRLAHVLTWILAVACAVMLIVSAIASRYERLGHLAALSNDLVAADDAFRAAQSLRPGDADIGLAAASAIGGAIERGVIDTAQAAERWADISTQLLPESPRAWEVAGMIALANANPAQATSRLARATELAPVNPRIWHERGVAAILAGDLVDARSSLGAATDLAPDSVPSWLALRDVCTALADQECVADAQRRLSDMPQ